MSVVHTQQHIESIHFKDRSLNHVKWTHTLKYTLYTVHDTRYTRMSPSQTFICMQVKTSDVTVAMEPIETYVIDVGVQGER